MALFNVNCQSAALGMETHFNVIIPQIYPYVEDGKKADKPNSHPVLYLLHGLFDNENSWLRHTSIERYAEEKGIAVVLPTSRRGWYCDSILGNYYTFVAEELPKFISEFFPTISLLREDTFIAGLSMGGYGALKIALMNPNRFSFAGALSGALNIRTGEINELLTQEKILTSKEDVEKNDPFIIAKQLASSGKEKPDFYMWCGTEDSFYETNVKMYDHLKSLGFNVEFSSTPGDHSWKYWDREIQNVIDRLPIKNR